MNPVTKHVRRFPLAVWAALLTALVLAGGIPARAAHAADEDATELAKKTQNPVADLISVPFQSNFNFNTGEKDATVYVLNVQRSGRTT